MMAVTAHSLNVWQRFQKTAADTSTVEFAVFKKIVNASNIAVISVCRKERHILELVSLIVTLFHFISYLFSESKGCYHVRAPLPLP